MGFMDTNNNTKAAEAVKPIAAAPSTGYQGNKTGGFPPRKPGFGGQGGFNGKKSSFRRDGKPGQFVKPDVDFKILNIRRVARITKGGKRFTFAVAVVVGDKKGKVGVGTGKAGDTASAIDKAVKSGKKNMIKVNMNKGMSIPHETEAKYASSIVALRPAKGRGLVAGSSARIVLNLAGITDITSKFYSRSKNPLNNAQATIMALKKLS